MHDKKHKIWIHFRPSIVSLIIPLSCFILFLMIRSSLDLKILYFSLIFLSTMCPLWLFFTYILFPRVVVTIIDENNACNLNTLILLADGKEIYKKTVDILLPIQFSFQVWRREKYDLYLKVEQSGKIKTLMKEANTYEHTVCHVTFEFKGKEI